jgi:glycosyltransferase involved in cell wall biosynthesis
MTSLLVGGISLLGELTGIGRCTFEVTRRLAASGGMNLSFYYGYISSKLRTSLEGEGISGSLSLAKSRISRMSSVKKCVRSLCEAATRFHPGRFDVYWEPNLAPLPVLSGKSRSVAATVPDFSWLLHPEWHPKERVEHFQRAFPRMLPRIDRIITYSAYIRDEAVALFGLDPSRIEVIPNGVDTSLFHPYPPEETETFRRERALPDRFVLFAGTLEPRKNVVRVIEAFRRLPAPVRAECSLVLAGAKGWRDSEILDLVRDSGASVMHLGYVTYRELAYLYSLAEVFVFPSLYEGFGLPPLEAMACGAPVVSSGAASLPEVCGDAVLYADPEDADSIAGALLRILEDRSLGERLAEAGFRRSALFSWDACASHHEKLFLTLAGSR